MPDREAHFSNAPSPMRERRAGRLISFKRAHRRKRLRKCCARLPERAPGAA
jgi:hypothetical protein